jgi:pimeloyl-ACP methyl ester carboxylesterase
VLIDAVPLLDGFQWPRVVRLMRLPVIGELMMGSQFDQGTQRALLRLHRRVDERRLAELGSELGSLEIPALVVWGERDPWLGPELADAYSARLPNATARRLPDAGHWPWRDDSGVVEIVAEFLARAPL